MVCSHIEICRESAPWDIYLKRSVQEMHKSVGAFLDKIKKIEKNIEAIDHKVVLH